MGGTSAKVACVNAAGKIVRNGSVPTGSPNPADLARRIAASLDYILEKDKPIHVGVGVAGDIDSDNGVVRVSPNLGWKNVPLKKLLQRHLKCPITVDNDANAAAWGVYKEQAPKGVGSVIVMTLGTGVGGGIVLDGKLFRGATGSAGEVGHMNIEENGPLCNCGNRGCLETYIGAPHLMRLAQSDLGKGARSSLQTLFTKDPAEVTPLQIAEAARKGDAYAKTIWRRAGNALGIAVGDLIYILNPQMIFFTGGIAQSGPLIMKPMMATLKKRAFKTPVNSVKIKVAEEASHIGVLGAALL